MMRPVFVMLGLLIVSSIVSAQDTNGNSEKILDEIVVTATRTENKVSNVPLPVQIISASDIQRSGSEKLIDVLQMQTGLVIATNPLGVSLQGYPNPFGTGIQMQGMDPGYTLIMIDGEPLSGRNGGVLNLDRIAVNNIQRIEVLRGPATSLYGSDALAGVINIITRTPEKNEAGGRLHYGSNNALGITFSGALKGKQASLELFGNRSSNDGWDFDKSIYGKTIDPSVSYNFSAKSHIQLNEKNKLLISARYFNQTQFNDYEIIPKDLPKVVTGTTVEDEKSVYASWDYKPTSRLNIVTGVYATGYNNFSHAYLQENDSLYEKITLSQSLIRPEVQVNIGQSKNQWVAGAGINFESVHSNRYSNTQRLNAWFTYLQKQIVFFEKLNVIAGARFDKNELYTAQLSPKLALAYKVRPSLILKGSVGTGFKAPDFRQQFLDFSNSLVGYTIIGARELGNGLARLQRSGLLEPGIDISPYKDGVALNPERSVGINLGVDYTLKSGTVLQVNMFRNDINNLIETYSLPFKQTNDKEIFSYTNVNKVFTEGVEVNIQHKVNTHFRIRGGYNFLIAKDKEVLDQIRRNQIFKRDVVTGHSQLVTLSDYKGLYNRSAHTFNVSATYLNDRYKAGATLSVKYRGKYGFQGVGGYSDGNLILDDPREFVSGFALVNLVLKKDLGNHINIQGGVENLLNYTEPVLMPSQYGRGYFLNINFKF